MKCLDTGDNEVIKVVIFGVCYILNQIAILHGKSMLWK